MKQKLIFLLLFLLLFTAKSQVLNPETEWFNLENFLMPNVPSHYNIKQMELSLSRKPDGEKMSPSKQVIQYNYSVLGLLNSIQSFDKGLEEKENASIQLSYNSQKQLSIRQEDIGPFHFSFHYYYDDEKRLKRQLKLGKGDTLLDRHNSYAKIGKTVSISTLNSIGRPYQITTLRWSNDSSKKTIRKRYIKSQFYKEAISFYQKNQIVSLKEIFHYQNKKVKTQNFEYLNNRLDKMDIKADKQLLIKRAILYSKNGLVETVVERRLRESEIRVYHFNYQFW